MQADEVAFLVADVVDHCFAELLNLDASIGYVGVTSTFLGDFPAMEAVIAREQPDFVQID